MSEEGKTAPISSATSRPPERPAAGGRPLPGEFTVDATIREGDSPEQIALKRIINRLKSSGPSQ